MDCNVFARAIVSIEQNYGLRLDARSTWLRMDDWKRLGRDQMGQKCGRGWYGLRGACKRGKKGADNSAAIKASKVALADKIRKRKGLTDRNAPKFVPPLSPELSNPIKIYEHRFASIFGMDEELKSLQANLDRVSAKKESKSSAQIKAKILKELAKTQRARDQRRATLIQTDIGGKSVKVTAAGQDPDGSTFAIVQMNGKERGSRIGANLRIMDGVVENIPPAMHPETVHFSKEAHDHLKNHGPELQEFANFVSRAIPSGVGKDLNPVVRDEIKARERAQSDEYTRLSEIAHEARQLNKSNRSDSPTPIRHARSAKQPKQQKAPRN